MEYYSLPEEYQTTHVVCYEIVKQIEDFILCKEYEFLQISGYPLTKEELEKYNESGDIWEFLKNNKEECFYKQLKKSLLLGLLGDFCYFMQESLHCSNKMRLVVAYALLRRPIVDNLKILLRVLFDDKFYDDFVNRDDYDPIRMDDTKLKNLLKKTDSFRFAQPITGDFMYHWIYDKTNNGSIINLSNRAIHPVTTRPWNKTGEMNLNFMFMNANDINGLCKHYYAILPAILIFFWELFNTLVFGLFPNEVNNDLFEKRAEKLVEITNPIHNTIKKH